MKSILACNLKLDLPQCGAPYACYMPHGLGIIMEVMQHADIPFEVFDTYVTGNTDDFLNYYHSERQEVLLFSGILGNQAIPYFQHVFSRIKEINPAAIIILGGPIASIYPEFLLSSIPVDIVVIGEGEQTILELAANDFSIGPDLVNIKGIGFKNREQAYLTPSRDPLPNPLDAHSFTPLFEQPGMQPLLDSYVTAQKALNRGWELTSSRGCFGNCTFCKKVFDKPIRSFSPEHVVDTIEHIQRRHGLNRFSFLDENFVSNRRQLTRFLDLIEERQLGIQWRFNCRIDNLPTAYLDRMERLGLYGIMLGVESGSQTILNYYNKEIDLAKYRESIREIARRRLLFASFIIGAEIESEQTIQENIDFIKYLGLRKKDLGISFLSVIPGTALFDDLCARGLIQDKEAYIRNYVGDVFQIEFNISKLTDQELLAARDRMIAAAQA